MNIGFDAKRVFFNRSGLGNYGRNILSYLQKYYPDNNFFLFSTKKKNKINFTLSDNVEVVEPKNSNFLNNTIWRTKKILKEPKFKKLDIYHGLSNELPFGISKFSVASVVTVHDLIFLRFPHLYKKFDQKIYLKKVKKACSETDKIIAISNQTKNDLINFLKFESKKIDVVYQGCNSIFYQKISENRKNRIRKKYKLPSSFLLNVGTIEERKRALLIIKALNYAKIDIPLVVIGKPSSYCKIIQKYISENNMKSRVKILNNVSSDELPAIYQSSEIFIYPSIFEGFGIPLIEAFVSEVPVITSDIDIFKEVGKNAVLYFKNDDYKNLSEKILFLIKNKSVQNKLIEAGKNRAKFFSGKKVADDLMKIYKSII